MRILILGGGGFLGQKLAKTLAKRGTLRGQAIAAMALADIAAPTKIDADFECETATLDVADRGAVDAMTAKGWDVVFHLAAVVSGQAEADFVSGMRANFFGTLNLLESLRSRIAMPVVVYASSAATYGGEIPHPIRDWTQLNPQTSYGTQKAIGELLLNDYSRRGFIDGRGLRLPTVAIRPGKPNTAASSFFSSIIREPLQGQPAMCPVPVETEGWLASPHATVENMIRSAELETEALGQNRNYALPGITVTVAEMLEALGSVGGEAALALVDHDPDETIQTIIGGWPTRMVTEKADALGMIRDADFEAIVRGFIDDELGGKVSL